MSDPLRTDTPRALEGALDLDRDVKIEQLLLAGLDHYFSAEYEQAVNVWTRALFLDRSHAKARAYIERARSALAERQRESEELLQHGVAALQRGEPDEARRLLETALRRGAPSEDALVVLDQLHRLERSAAQEPPPARRSGRRPAMPGASGTIDHSSASRFSVLVWILALAMVGGGIVAVGVMAPSVDWRPLLMLPSAPSSLPPVATPDRGLSLPRRGEGALARARAFSASGHLREALTALEAVRATDPQKLEADQLRAQLQRQLIELTSVDPLVPSERAKGDGHLP